LSTVDDLIAVNPTSLLVPADPRVSECTQVSIQDESIIGITRSFEIFLVEGSLPLLIADNSTTIVVALDYDGVIIGEGYKRKALAMKRSKMIIWLQ